MLEINQYISFPFDTISGYNLDKDIVHNIDIYKPTFTQVDQHNLSYTIDNNTFTFNLRRQRFSSDKKSILIICSKNNSQVLSFSLEKLKQSGDTYNHDILLVDDRSDNNSILNLSDQFNTSYLRIDNSSNIFNYSVINNIAASYAKYYNKDLIIFYNNDLWPSSNDTLSNIINKHHRHGATLSGVKLIYPSKTEYAILDKPHILDRYMNQLYNTIQHGGISFGIRASSFVDNKRTYIAPNIVLIPSHTWRFYDNNEIMASYDQRCFAVTGALHIINTDKFINIGGLNCTMSTSFQDIDLCLRLFKNQEPIYYIGSEYMYHAESVTHFNEKITETKDFISDNIIWDYTYGVELPNIIGLQFRR